MNSDEIRALGFATMDDGEELARAEIYGLLARLWFSPPDDELMQQFKVAVTQAPQSGAFLEAPWEAMVATFRELDRSAIAAEYDALVTEESTHPDAPHAHVTLPTWHTGLLFRPETAELVSGFLETGAFRGRADEADEG